MKIPVFNYKKLPWDSDFFQKEIYQVDATENYMLSTKDILDIQKKRNRFFYLISKKEQSKLADFLIDDKVYFKKMVSNPPATKITFYNSKTDLMPKLLELAFDAGKYSRFRIDPILGVKFREMYALWLQKSLSGELADFVLVERKKDSLLGFVTLKEEKSSFTIGLIAVSTESRGLGIGRKLLAQCENLALEKNIKSIVVPTQRENKQACSFYLKSGYKEWKNEFIYHINTYADTF